MCVGVGVGVCVWWGGRERDREEGRKLESVVGEETEKGIEGKGELSVLPVLSYLPNVMCCSSISAVVIDLWPMKAVHFGICSWF